MISITSAGLRTRHGMDQPTKELNDAHNVSQTIITTSSHIRPLAVNQPHQNHRHNHRIHHHTKSGNDNSQRSTVAEATTPSSLYGSAVAAMRDAANTEKSAVLNNSIEPPSVPAVSISVKPPNFSTATTTVNAMVHQANDSQQQRPRKSSNDYDAFADSVDYNNKLLDNFVAGFASLADGVDEEERADNNNNRGKKVSVASSTNATVDDSVIGDDDQDKFDTMELMPTRNHMRSNSSPQPSNTKVMPPSEEELARICSLTAQKLKALVELIDADKAQLTDLRTGLDQASLVLSTVTRLQNRRNGGEIDSQCIEPLPNSLDRHEGHTCCIDQQSSPSVTAVLNCCNEAVAMNDHGFSRQTIPNQCGAVSPSSKRAHCTPVQITSKPTTFSENISPIGFYAQPQQQCILQYKTPKRSDKITMNNCHRGTAANGSPMSSFAPPGFVRLPASMTNCADNSLSYGNLKTAVSDQELASPELSVKSTQTEKRLLDMTAVRSSENRRRTQSPPKPTSVRQAPATTFPYATNDDDDDLFSSSSSTCSTPNNNSNVLFSSASFSTSFSSITSCSVNSLDLDAHNQPVSRGYVGEAQGLIDMRIEHVQKNGHEVAKSGYIKSQSHVISNQQQQQPTKLPSESLVYNVNTVIDSNNENRPYHHTLPEANVNTHVTLTTTLISYDKPISTPESSTVRWPTENEPKEAQPSIIPDILVDGELEESSSLILPEKSVYISKHARQKIAKKQILPSESAVPLVVISNEDNASASVETEIANVISIAVVEDSLSKQHLSLRTEKSNPAGHHTKPATKRKKPRKAKQLNAQQHDDDEDEDELSDVEQDGEVPSEVKEWLADTFTRRRSSLAPKVVEKRKFKSVANAIRAGIFVDRLFQNRLYRRLSSNLGLPTSLPVVQTLKNIDEWTFDVFLLDKASEGHALRYVLNALLTKYDLYSKLKIATPTLDHFVRAMEDGYSKNNNPYHNPIHAADVAQTMHYMMFNTGLVNWLSDIEVFASIFAAVIHDFEHTGTTNNFHIATLSDLALLYNDRAVLENHHLSAAFRVMQKDENNITANMSREDFYTFRALVVEMVLATDMSFHFAQVKHIKAMCSAAPDSIDKAKALSLVLHCCDISHPGKPWHLHSAWTSSLLAEFFTQGDREKELDLPYSPLCDRNNTMVPQSQIGFIDIIVEPTMTLVGTMIEKIVEPLLNLEKQAREKEAAAAATTAEDGTLLTTSSSEATVSSVVAKTAPAAVAGPSAPDNIMARMGRAISVGSNVNMLNRQRVAAETTPSTAGFQRPWIKCLEDNKALWRQKAAAETKEKEKTSQV